MKKIIFFTFTLTFSINTLFACDVCQKNQPKVLQNITHGEGPQGNLDYVIIWTATAIVLLALGMSLKYLIQPNEADKKHIKNIVCDEN